MLPFLRPSASAGFAFTELLVAIFVIGVSTVSITGLALLGSRSSFESVAQGSGLALANETLEQIRLMDYDDVGFPDAVLPEPDGTLERTQVAERAGIAYQLAISISMVDDPANGSHPEGVLTEETADYKIVKADVVWQTSGRLERNVFAATVISHPVLETCEPGAEAVCPPLPNATYEGEPLPLEDCPATGICLDPYQPTPPPCPVGTIFCDEVLFSPTPSPHVCSGTPDCDAGDVCLLSAGVCVPDCTLVQNTCPNSLICNSTTGTCDDLQLGNGGDGCTSDAECSADGSLVCDPNDNTCRGSWCQVPDGSAVCGGGEDDPGCHCLGGYPVTSRMVTIWDQVLGTRVTDAACNILIDQYCGPRYEFRSCAQDPNPCSGGNPPAHNCTLGEYNGHFYYFCPDPVRRTDVDCGQVGSTYQLARINDAAENNWIAGNLTALNGAQSDVLWWMGAKRVAFETDASPQDGVAPLGPLPSVPPDILSRWGWGWISGTVRIKYLAPWVFDEVSFIYMSPTYSGYGLISPDGLWHARIDDPEFIHPFVCESSQAGAADYDAGQCFNGQDDDGDTARDFRDSGCFIDGQIQSISAQFEPDSDEDIGPDTGECGDNSDNNGNGLIDGNDENSCRNNFPCGQQDLPQNNYTAGNSETCQPYCGDGFCDSAIGEDAASCPQDCGAGGF